MSAFLMRSNVGLPVRSTFDATVHGVLEPPSPVLPLPFPMPMLLFPLVRLAFSSPLKAPRFPVLPFWKPILRLPLFPIPMLLVPVFPIPMLL